MTKLINEDCKVKLIVNVVFKSTKNHNDKRNLCVKSKNTTDIDEIFSQSIKKHKQLIESLKSIDLIPEGIESIVYNFTEVVRIETYTEPPDWLKNKKGTIDTQNKNDNRCFQCSIIAGLNYQTTKNNPERVSKIKLFINQYDRDGINLPPQEQDYKTFEKNNKSITLNILSVQHNTEKISHAYK